MDREKLKLIIKNLESLVDCLKSEVYSDVDAYSKDPVYKEVATFIEDYDEVFYDEEEDDFESIRVNQKYKLTNDDDGDGL
jgi:hypothetical protein